MAAYIIGNAAITVTLWRSIASSMAAGSKPRCTSIVPPTVSKVIITVYCPMWNSGSMPLQTSPVVLLCHAIALEVSAAYTEACECITPFCLPVVPLVYMISASCSLSISTSGKVTGPLAIAWFTVETSAAGT